MPGTSAKLRKKKPSKIKLVQKKKPISEAALFFFLGKLSMRTAEYNTRLLSWVSRVLPPLEDPNHSRS